MASSHACWRRRRRGGPLRARRCLTINNAPPWIAVSSYRTRHGGSARHRHLAGINGDRRLPAETMTTAAATPGERGGAHRPDANCPRRAATLPRRYQQVPEPARLTPARHDNDDCCDWWRCCSSSQIPRAHPRLTYTPRELADTTETAVSLPPDKILYPCPPPVQPYKRLYRQLYSS